MKLDHLVATFALVASVAFDPLIASEGSYSIALVPKGPDREVWDSIHAGALKAKQELGEEGIDVEVLWRGSAVGKPREQQIQVVDSFTGQRLSGILAASMNEEDLAEMATVRGDGNIPMIQLNRALDSEQPISFVALDNYQGGALAADRISQLIRGEGSVILMKSGMSDINAEAREAGFRETIRKNHPSIRIIAAEEPKGTSYRAAYEKSESLLNRYGRRVDAIFVSDEMATGAFIDALRDFQLAGQVSLVGYNANEKSLASIRNGDAQGLIVSDPFRMGYLGVRSLIDHLKGVPSSTIVDSGLVLVTDANIDSDAVVALLNPPVAEYLK
ncbi:MAG: substrate-binding domain-containing protein [Verrucomicrobiota bacterium]